MDLSELCYEVIGWIYMFDHGVQVIQKSRSHIKIVGISRMTWNKLHAEDPQISGTAIQNLVAWVTGTKDLCILSFH